MDEAYPDVPVVRVVLDNLNTHRRASLYEAFPAAEARRIAKRLEFHHTPKHGRWLNMAEIEFSIRGAESGRSSHGPALPDSFQVAPGGRVLPANRGIQMFAMVIEALESYFANRWLLSSTVLLYQRAMVLLYSSPVASLDFSRPRGADRKRNVSSPVVMGPLPPHWRRSWRRLALLL